MNLVHVMCLYPTYIKNIHEKENRNKKHIVHTANLVNIAHFSKNSN